MADKNTLYGLIGYPIDFVRSPGILNAYLADHGLLGHMVPFGVQPDKLKQALTGLGHVENLAGFFVTMPFKEAIVPLLDDLSETARIAGAVNIVRRTSEGRLVGHQLDGAGFVGAMEQSGITIKGATAFIAGAGGVSAGICCALAKSGIARIDIANRNLDRADALVQRLREAFPDSEFTTTNARPRSDIDIVINATSLGLSADDPLPIDLADVRSSAFVGDVVNIPGQTTLLEQGQARGCRTQHGKAMFAPQIELALEFFAKGIEV